MSISVVIVPSEYVKYSGYICSIAFAIHLSIIGILTNDLGRCGRSIVTRNRDFWIVRCRIFVWIGKERCRFESSRAAFQGVEEQRLYQPEIEKIETRIVRSCNQETVRPA